MICFFFNVNVSRFQVLDSRDLLKNSVPMREYLVIDQYYHCIPPEEGGGICDAGGGGRPYGDEEESS